MTVPEGVLIPAVKPSLVKVDAAVLKSFLYKWHKTTTTTPLSLSLSLSLPTSFSETDRYDRKLSKTVLKEAADKQERLSSVWKKLKFLSNFEKWI